MRGKLTPDAKATIQALRTEGATYQSLAETYGVSKTAVIYICNEQSKARSEEYKKSWRK